MTTRLLLVSTEDDLDDIIETTELPHINGKYTILSLEKIDGQLFAQVEGEFTDDVNVDVTIELSGAFFVDKQ